MSDNVPTVNVKVIEVDELKRQLGSIGTREDMDLETLCVIASLSIENICNGTKFIQRTFTEDYTAGTNGRLGGAKKIYLRSLPVVSVTSITDDDGNTVDSDDYTVIAKDGVLEHDWLWPAPIGRWTIVYTAGVWEDTDDVDWAVKKAAQLEAARIRAQKGEPVVSTSLSGRAGSRSTTKATRGDQGVGRVNPVVYQLLQPYLKRHA